MRSLQRARRRCLLLSDGSANSAAAAGGAALVAALPTVVQVAVPLPLQGPLTYTVPEAWRQFARVGCRARVPAGRRTLTGVIVGTAEEIPRELIEDGVELRPLLELIDLVPLLDRDLLELARFAADYYLAPLGEVLRAIVPPALSGWGARRVQLTSAGALSRPRDEAEARIVETLLESGPTTVARLQARLAIPGLERRLADLRAEQRVVLEVVGGGRGARYVGAVELPAGRLEEQLEACGRSAPGRGVIEYLASLGRPATLREVRDATGCSSGVVRRLVRLGVLRSFTQLERLSLDRHLLAARTPATGVLELRADQAAAVSSLEQALAASSYRAFLLAGITGSGKTEVYLRAVEKTLALGRAAILLVPEIALVPALASELRLRFGEHLAILHSNLSRAERQQEWERVREQNARVVLGPRSAVFAPVEALGLVVVDEEHDSAYKQEVTPRYQGRDLALVRARSAGAVAVLVSATPSLETRHNVKRQRYQELRLVARAGRGELPEGVLVDLRREPPGRGQADFQFSTTLCREIEQALEGDGQVILLRNRRGYAPMLLCRSCGEDHRCADCGLPKTFHRRAATLVCHHCGARCAAPQQCTRCGAAALETIGAGTERVEEHFRERFPGVSVAVLDRDSARSPGGAAAILERFGRGDSRVLVGTQMVAKGHHFPRVALAAMLQADSYLGFPDFRAVEKTYALLTQLAGRAGRGERAGRVVIQTYNAEHYAIRAALEHDDQAFAEQELRFRRVFHYPPYTRMVQLLLQDRSRERAEQRMRSLAARLDQHPLAREVRVSGPAPAPLERLRGAWRFQLFVRAPSGARLRRLVREAVLPHAPPKLTIDIDPYDLL